MIQVDNTDLIAFAQNTEGIILNVGAVKSDELRDAQAAVEKQGQDAEIALAVRAADTLQETDTLIQRQVARQSFLDFG